MIKKILLSTSLLAFCICCSLGHTTYAFDLRLLNAPAPFDSSYIISYKDQLVTRVYGSHKYTNFSLPNVFNRQTRFKSNTTFNQGLGVSYSGLSLNLSFGLPWFNANREERGTTTWFDGQMHFYRRKNMIDIFLQRYQGFYIDRGLVSGLDGYFNDENIKLRSIGGVYTHIHNWKKYTFTFGASQDEFQKQSAGSFLYGASAIYTVIKNDKGDIADARIPDMDNYQGVHHIHTFNLGANFGYGYNLVFLKNFYAGALVSFSTSLSLYSENKMHLKEHRPPNSSVKPIQYGLAPTSNMKVALGYNSTKWAVAFYFVNQINSIANYDKRYVTSSIGNVRINFVYRIRPGKRIKKKLEPIRTVF